MSITKWQLKPESIVLHKIDTSLFMHILRKTFDANFIFYGHAIIIKKHLRKQKIIHGKLEFLLMIQAYEIQNYTCSITLKLASPKAHITMLHLKRHKGRILNHIDKPTSCVDAACRLTLSTDTRQFYTRQILVVQQRNYM